MLVAAEDAEKIIFETWGKELVKIQDKIEKYRKRWDWVELGLVYTLTHFNNARRVSSVVRYQYHHSRTNWTELYNNKHNT